MRKIQAYIFAGTFTLISSCGGSPSKEELKIAEKACIDLIDDSIGIFTDNKNGPKIFDSYKKKGKIVLEVGYKVVKYKGSKEPYSVRLCVVDMEKGTVALPSVLEYSEWRR